MIPVTAEMINAGDIDEEYADLMKRITFLLDLWHDKPASNNDPYGRMVYFLLWLRQEVQARRIPIPLDRSYLGTLKYLTGSGDVRDSDDVGRAMGEMIEILQGRGLIKPRHYPLLVSLMDDFIAAVEKNRPGLAETDAFFREYCQKRDDIVAGTLKPPIEPTKERNRFDFASAKSLAPVLPGETEHNYELSVQMDRTTYPLIGYRPFQARKPPMPAPVPGLERMAPDFTALRDQERRKAAGEDK
ncbi:hypothetical protein [Acetobacter thailandicus]|uniref:hypothetical protein n=1 Tax=Acetobacter thailandicus TaxID=1502842 RepID=UPI001BA4A7CC|nr:hypothetical protein [Acetobacter thailandicus]MBS0979200.1 hypothetical protein [Acetobacter thailandicus]MBS0986712.1 hypothetical protein [Acetobacter thailandicus]